MHCEAHDGLVENINRVHKSIGQLYDLDREKTDKLASLIKARIIEATKE